MIVTPSTYNSNFHLIPSRGLPCGRDRPSTLFYTNNQSYLHECSSDSYQTWYLMSPLSVPNFSPIGACIRVLLRILQSVRKEVEENEEKNPKLWLHVSQKWLERFSSNLESGLPYLAGTSVATLVSIRYGITELQRCENYIYFLPVNILMIWRAGFLGRTIHYSVS